MKKISIFIGFIFIIVVVIFILPSKHSKIPILEYHVVRENIPDDGTGYLYVTPENFEDQISILKSNGYNFITFDDLEQIDNNKMEMPDKPIIITFDDGYLNNYVNAYPILKKLDAKATFFVSTANIVNESLEYDENKLKFMSWEQLLEMENSGVIDIQSHGDSHINLAESTPYDITQNVDTSYELICKNINKTPIAFSVPYGSSSKKADKIIFEKYDYIIKVYKDSIFPNKNIFYRYSINNDMTGYDILDLIN